jgi:hypothetical protein
VVAANSLVFGSGDRGRSYAISVTATWSEFEVVKAFVKAHARRDAHGQREPIWCVRSAGGLHIQHPGLDEGDVEGVDEAMLDGMHLKGLVTIDYQERSFNVTPTDVARAVVEESDRIQSKEAVADLQPLLAAVDAQADATNPLAWRAVRPVLAAIRGYWQQGGFSHNGVALLALASALPDDQSMLFAATIRQLESAGYLEPTGQLTTRIADERGRSSSLPGAVALTEKAHTILDGWPGAAPEELVENLLAVVHEAAEDEPDPAKKRHLQSLYGTIKDVGVNITSEVLAKVLTGGLM